MVGRASTAALRVLYAAFALVWVALAIRSAHAGRQQEAIALGALAVAWTGVVIWVVLRPTSRWGREGRSLTPRSRRGRGGGARPGR